MTRLFLSTFVSVFVAELLDKTQLLVFALGGEAKSTGERLGIFWGATAALALSSAMAILLSAAVVEILREHARFVQLAAGGVVMLIGLIMVAGAVRAGGV